jgi:hypothetical protein
LKRKRPEDYEVDEEAEILSRARDKLHSLIKDFGKQGIRLDDISRKYYEKYGHYSRFTIGGELDLDLESIVENLPNIRREGSSIPHSDSGENFGRDDDEGFPTEGTWDLRGGGNNSSPPSPHSRRRESGNSTVYYYDDNKSYLDENGYLDVTQLSRKDRGDHSEGYTGRTWRGEGSSGVVDRGRSGRSSKYADVSSRDRKDEGGDRSRKKLNSPRNESPRQVTKYESDSAPLIDYGVRSSGRIRDDRIDYGTGGSSRSRDDRIDYGAGGRGRNKTKQCLYFNTPRGCRHGHNCEFTHTK